MSQSSDAWAEIAIACEIARMEIALKTCEMLDVPVFAPPPYNWAEDGDGHDAP